MRIAVKAMGISLAGLMACNPFAPDQTVILQVDALSASPFIEPGSSLMVVLAVTRGGCIIFDHVAEMRRPSSAYLAAIGRNTAKGRPNVTCPTVIRTDPITYTLDPPFQSPFTVTVDRGSLPPLTAIVRVQ
jgi:hypothetical protein